MKGSERQWRSTLVVVLAAAALVRLAAVLFIHWHPWFDDAWYFRTALDLASGRGYLDAHGRPTAYFPVGYPATLAVVLRVFGGSLKVAQLLNVAFSLSTMLCVFGIMRTLGGSERSATLATALFGFLPNQVVSCCVTMSEITFTFALTLGIWLALNLNWERRPAWGLVVGAVFGWATLIRPQAMFVPVLLVPAIFSIRGGRARFGTALSRGAVVVVALALVVSPWTLRNYRLFGAFVSVSTNGGENFLIGNNAKSTQHYTPAATFYPSSVDVTAMPELERDRLGGALARAYLRAHPLEAALRAPRKLWYMYRSDLGVTNWIWAAGHKDGTRLYYACQALTQGCYLLVLGGAFGFLVGLLRKRPTGVEQRLLALVVCAPVAYFSLVTLLFFGDARYHEPLVPLFAIAASHWFLATFERYKARAAKDEVEVEEPVAHHN